MSSAVAALTLQSDWEEKGWIYDVYASIEDYEIA